MAFTAWRALAHSMCASVPTCQQVSRAGTLARRLLPPCESWSLPGKSKGYGCVDQAVSLAPQTLWSKTRRV